MYIYVILEIELKIEFNFINYVMIYVTNISLINYSQQQFLKTIESWGVLLLYIVDSVIYKRKLKVDRKHYWGKLGFPLKVHVIIMISSNSEVSFHGSLQDSCCCNQWRMSGYGLLFYPHVLKLFWTMIGRCGTLCHSFVSTEKPPDRRHFWVWHFFLKF